MVPAPPGRRERARRWKKNGEFFRIVDLRMLASHAASPLLQGSRRIRTTTSVRAAQANRITTRACAPSH
jgi:hypothetical protein